MAGKLSRHDGYRRRLSLLVLFDKRGDIVGPEHREIGIDHLVRLRQVEPDLEKLQRVWIGAIEQREHLRVVYSLTCRQPLHITIAEARRRAQRVGVIDQSMPYDRHGLETAMGMMREAGNRLAMIHPPPILSLE